MSRFLKFFVTGFALPLWIVLCSGGAATIGWLTLTPADVGVRGIDGIAALTFIYACLAVPVGVIVGLVLGVADLFFPRVVSLRSVLVSMFSYAAFVVFVMHLAGMRAPETLDATVTGLATLGGCVLLFVLLSVFKATKKLLHWRTWVPAVIVIVLTAPVAVIVVSDLYTPNVGDGVLIDSYGEWVLEDTYELHIRRKSVSLVDYSLVRQSDNTIILTDDSFSDVMRWFFYWDAGRDELWIYSGDIGTSMWRQSPSGAYVEIYEDDPAFNLTHAPIEFADAVGPGR